MCSGVEVAMGSCRFSLSLIAVPTYASNTSLQAEVSMSEEWEDWQSIATMIIMSTDRKHPSLVILK